MAYGDIISSLVFETNNSDGSEEDWDASDEEREENEEYVHNPGIIQSFFSYWGYGSPSEDQRDHENISNNGSPSKVQNYTGVSPHTQNIDLGSEGLN